MQYRGFEINVADEIENVPGEKGKLKWYASRKGTFLTDEYSYETEALALAAGKRGVDEFLK